MPFRSVNLKSRQGYQPGMQRHHLLPRQLLSQRCFGRMFDAIGPDRLGIDDFRRNGLLLPARDDAVIRIGLPLHRGPHRLYNDLVVERTGQIERDWASGRWRASEAAAEQAGMRLALLQRALRRRLLQIRGARMRLNRRDPLGAGLDFTRLDALAELLWGGTASVLQVGAEGM